MVEYPHQNAVKLSQNAIKLFTVFIITHFLPLLMVSRTVPIVSRHKYEISHPQNAVVLLLCENRAIDNEEHRNSAPPTRSSMIMTEGSS